MALSKTYPIYRKDSTDIIQILAWFVFDMHLGFVNGKMPDNLFLNTIYFWDETSNCYGLQTANRHFRRYRVLVPKAEEHWFRFPEYTISRFHHWPHQTVLLPAFKVQWHSTSPWQHCASVKITMTKGLLNQCPLDQWIYCWTRINRFRARMGRNIP